MTTTTKERYKSMITGKALDGKPYAGNPHVRFDEGEVASAEKPRRGSLLCKTTKRLSMVCATAFAVTMTVRCAAGTYSLACDSNALIYGIGTNVRIPKDSKTYTIELWMKPSAVYASGEYRCMGQFGFEEGKSTPLAGRTLVSYKDGKVGVFNGGGNGWTTGTTTQIGRRKGEQDT